MARPFGTLKYNNIDDLQAGIDAYFAEREAKGLPCTMSSLATALNITTRTLSNYGQNDSYFPAINRARQLCLGYAENRLYDKDGVQGAKFYLSNNSERMGGQRYSDRQEVSVDVAPIAFVDDLGDS